MKLYLLEHAAVVKRMFSLLVISLLVFCSMNIFFFGF